MTRFFPSQLKPSPPEVTHGEVRVFNILKQSLSPSCYVWYEVVFGEREYKPDFLVIDREHGLFILEVKGWSKETILQGDEKTFKIKSKGKTSYPDTNPELKCQRYVRFVKQTLATWDELIDEFGRINFPIYYFSVFTNLTKDDFDEKIPTLLNPEYVIFSDDVKNKKKFIEKMYRGSEKLPSPLSIDKLDKIRISLRPEITITSHVDESGLLPGLVSEDESVDKFSRDFFAIDIQQEDIAKNLGTGPRLLRGMAGSGKTLIMLLRAKLLASNAEYRSRALKNVKPYRVLILCWNVSLANYMNQAFDNINIPLENRRNIEIMNFSKFVSRLRKKKPDFQDINVNDEKNINIMFKKINIKQDEKYDLVIIDEAQDFQDEWLEFLFKKIVKGDEPEDKAVLIAADDAQRIYKNRDFSWKSIGIPLQGRSRILRVIYRNSARVWGFAGLLLGNIGDYYKDLDEDDEEGNSSKNSKVYFAPKRGIDPKIIKCKNIEDKIKRVIEEINNLEKGYSYRNILILYRDNRKISENMNKINRLLIRLRKNKIPYQWISRDKTSKEKFDWVHESVKISTVHSAKGMDAPKVIVFDADDFDETNNANDDEVKVMYVALTRAREELVILYAQNKGLVPELLKAHKKYLEYKELFIKWEEDSKKMWGYDDTFIIEQFGENGR